MKTTPVRLAALTLLAACAGSMRHSPTGGVPNESMTASMEPAGAGMAGADMEYDGVGMAEAAAPASPQTWRRFSDAAQFAEVSLGGGNSLELRDVRVRVHVEGHRARTVVDHIFFNPHDRALEGTFRYSLPPEASVSGYAMYLGSGGTESPAFFGDAPGAEEAMRRREEALQGHNLNAVMEEVDAQAWGELRVGRFVRATRGREVYENVTRRQVDPALVEEVGPNSFEARVFPIQARAYHRVIVSYEQTLPRVGDELEYLFVVPEAELGTFDFELRADEALIRRARYTGDLRGAALRESGRFAHKVHVASNTQAGVVSYRFGAKERAGVETLVGTDPSTGISHFALRIQGDSSLGGGASGASSASSNNAVFLLDTSLSEHPDRFAIDVAILKAILERSSTIERFNVVTFDAGARWLTHRWLDNDAAGRARALAMIETVLLEGATDLSAALDALHAPPMSVRGQDADVFLLSDGAISWGERDLPTLARRRSGPWSSTRTFAYRTGLGAENGGLLRRLAGGGVFNCLSMEAVAGCAVAHQQQAFRVERVVVEGRGQNAASASEVLVAGGAASFAPGTELSIAGRLDRPGAARARLVGTLAGQPHTLTRDLDLRPRGELASRAWAEIAVAHLLADHDPEHEDMAVAIGQHYRVPSRVTSVLVLETDAEYEQYALEGSIVAPRVQSHIGRRAETAWARLQRVMRASADHHHLGQLEGGDVLRQLSAFVSQSSPTRNDFMAGRVPIPLGMQDDVPRAYREGISRDAEAVEHFRNEANRRHAQGQRGLAIRALSSGVENAPASAEVARSLAYTLMTWGANAEAAELLFSVLERRPYEPQSYRDLAGALWLERPSITALLFEAALAGEWDARFRGVQTVVQEEYALFAHAWIRQHPNSPLARFLRERQLALSLEVPRGDLRVTMTWNTDNTDIDLWVTDPSGEKCYYAHRNTSAGGELLDDVTGGFGPERFQLNDAPRGEYHVQAHYYGNNGNRLVADTYVTLTIARHVGTAQQQITRKVVRLENAQDVETAARFSF